MPILDRYLVHQFLRGFFVTTICLMGLYVVADFMSNLSEFIDRAEAVGGIWRIVLNYYAARVPWFFEMSGRVVVLLAAVFTIGSLQRHNELTALMAAGISRWRVAKPLVVVGVLVSLLAVANREFGVPAVRDLLCRNIQDLAGKQASPFTPQYDHATLILFDGGAIRHQEGKIEEFRCSLPADWPGVGRRIQAATAEFIPATKDHPAGYLLQGAEPAINWREQPSLTIGEQPAVLTARDCRWLQQPNTCFVVSSLTLEQLHKGQQWQQYSSTPQLIAGLHNPSLGYGANSRVLIHARFVQPLLDITLLVLGLPVALAAERRSVFVATGKTILLVAFFSLVVVVCHALGNHCILSPALAAWFPLLVLVPLTVLNVGPLLR